MKIMELNQNKKSKDHGNMRIQLRKIIVMSLIFCMIFSSISKYEVSLADATTSINLRRDYIEELIFLTPGTGRSTKYYMSTDNQKTWESVDTSGTVDISNLFAAKAVTLYFKGNKDGTAVKEVLPAVDKTLVVTYSVQFGTGVVTFTSTSPVQYKKGEFGAWKTAINNMPTAIYEVKGATLYFRTPAELDKRAGKVVTLKIPKSPAAPAVKLDGSKLSISGIKSGQTQYRVGDSAVWLTYTAANSKAKSIDLLTLLNPTSMANATPIPTGIIEFRNMGANKKPNSGVRTVEVTLQAGAPDTAVAVSGTSITITDSDQTKAYEYTLVTKGSVLNFETAKWTTVTSKKSVIVPKATFGDKILVRVKSTTDSKTKKIVLASMYKEFIVSTITTK